MSFLNLKINIPEPNTTHLLKCVYRNEDMCHVRQDVYRGEVWRNIIENMWKEWKIKDRYATWKY